MESRLGALLRRHRAMVGLTQEELAARSGISVQAISALERGVRRFPQVSTLGLLAAALRLDDEQRQELIAAASREQVRVEPPIDSPAPKQLPFAVADFAGREDAVRRLLGELEDGSLIAITGMAGVGKTALAVHVGHRVADAYPDGQLYLDLRGYGAGPRMPVGEALRTLMRALGTEAESHDEADVALLAARLRTMLAGRRVLLLLDNAADPDQVAHLLPGTPGSAAIVTSRRAFIGLGGVTHLPLDPLSESGAVAMLRRIAGADRVDREGSASARVVELCGHLPLAIRIIASRLAARPNWPVSHLADRLADERDRLDELTLDDLGVRASFAVSVDQLATSPLAIDRQSADAVARLAIPDWFDLGVAVAARLLELPEADAERVLERLVDANLLIATRPSRYRQHDLVRVYARGRAEQTLDAVEKTAAMTRVLDLYIAVAWRSTQPGRSAVTSAWGQESWQRDSPEFASTIEAMTWLDAENDNLAGAVSQAVNDASLDGIRAVRLAIGLHEYIGRRQDWSVSRRMATLVLGVPAVDTDLTAQLLLRYMLGAACAELRSYEEAVTSLLESARLARPAGHPEAEAMIFVGISRALGLAGRLDEGVQYGERALDASRDISNQFAEAYACLALGKLYTALGDEVNERRFHQRSHAIFESLGDKVGMANTLLQVGVGQMEARRFHEALTPLHDALQLYHDLGRPGEHASTLKYIAAVHESMGEHDQALDALYEALDVIAEHREWQIEAEIRFVLGRVLAATGRIAEAREQMELALGAYEQHGSPAADEIRDRLDALDHPAAGTQRASGG